MKFKLLMATATAASVLMTVAAVADSNSSVLNQQGNSNVATVEQSGGTNSRAGVKVAPLTGHPGWYTGELRQNGDHNTMTITQTGDNNTAGDAHLSHSDMDGGVHQTGDYNELTLGQDSRAAGGGTNGNIVHTVQQTSSAAIAGPTNSAAIIQQRSDTGPGSLAAQNEITRVLQTHTGGAANTLNITQTGEFSSWYSSFTQGNLISKVEQDGSGNTATIVQKGIGPDVVTSGTQRRGPANVLKILEQTGDLHMATLTQNGFKNYIGTVSQTGGNQNTVSIILTGEGNGGNSSAHVNNGRAAVGALTNGALASGATASNATQIGSNNSVQYEVAGGNDNQFGFYQDGLGNKAESIYITGDRNQLGVYQEGDRNVLTLAQIDGSDNVVGLRQIGSDNTAALTITGASSDRNGGAHSFTANPALSAGLTAGLIEQLGNWNSATLDVSGSDNVFATKQDSGAYAGSQVTNSIVGTITGNSNQVAVKQIGVDNSITFTQNGGANNAYVTQ